MVTSYCRIKRLMDAAVSVVALLLLLPVLAGVALLIVLDSRGSPVFMQERVGRSGKPFYLFKFRSMVKDAASKGTYWTQQNDARITRVGRFLRKTSLDELPQLWNVVKGDMSLIGPRPELPLQEASYRPEDWTLRHSVRPGITGLAQVNGRSAITPDIRLKYDLQYVSACSAGMDARILVKTLWQVLRRHGVN